MTRILAPTEKYSVIEVTLAGRGLSADEKMSAYALFERSHIPKNKLVCSDYKKEFRLSCYTRSAEKLQEFRKKYRSLRPAPFVLQIKKLKRRDWFDKWKLDYHIRSLGAKFTVVPIWEKDKPRSKRRIPVFLEPGSAFGSGYHETTRLMTRLLELLDGKIGSFLDIGCGTGILSVVASKLGATKIVGFDNDRPSARFAEKNFQANRCEGGVFFCAQLKGVKLREHFDAVGANLLSRTLLELQKEITDRVRPGGFLLVSGIALQNFPTFKRGFSSAGFKCLKTLRGRRWVAVLYKRGQAVK